MGLLTDMGPLLPYEEGEKIQPCLKNIAIRQFLKIFNKYRQWNKPSGIHSIKWGEEIEGNFLSYGQNG
jgi:hypothetical protein